MKLADLRRNVSWPAPLNSRRVVCQVHPGPWVNLGRVHPKWAVGNAHATSAGHPSEGDSAD